jgi:hypothetical protein
VRSEKGIAIGTQRLLQVVLALVALTIACMGDEVSDEERDRAVAAAQQVYAQEKAAGRDFSNGPCIAEEAIDDWSVDIAHDPRQDIDDQPENQCRLYRDGTTHHFVELDPEGKLIRAK